MCDGMMLTIDADGFAQIYDDTYDIVIHCESEEEQNEVAKKLNSMNWIPVTERLPEEEYVLISKKPSKISGDKWSVAIAIRTADPRSGKIQWRDSGFGIIQDEKVLAWMPLPEPYEEVE